MHRKMPVRFGKGRIPLEFAYFIHLTVDNLVTVGTTPVSDLHRRVSAHAGRTSKAHQPMWLMGLLVRNTSVTYPQKTGQSYRFPYLLSG